jgi:hypothetical protein
MLMLNVNDWNAGGIILLWSTNEFGDKANKDIFDSTDDI